MSIKISKLAKPNKLVTALRRRKTPVQAQRLCDLYGGRRRAWRRRAEHSAGMVIGTKDGYVMTAKATQAQMNNWRARYNGQTQKMQERGQAVERMFKRRLGKNKANKSDGLCPVSRRALALLLEFHPWLNKEYKKNKTGG